MIAAETLRTMSSATLYEVRLLSWAQGYESRQWEIDWANDRADTYYEIAYNPGTQLTEVRERRMLAAAESYWAELVEGWHREH